MLDQLCGSWKNTFLADHSFLVGILFTTSGGPYRAHTIFFTFYAELTVDATLVSPMTGDGTLMTSY